MTRTSLLALAFGALPGAALAAMDAREFDAFTCGKTFVYTESDQAYGVEEYLDDRRVRWSFLDGAWKYGTWYPSGDEICFVYEDDPEPHCWTFSRRGSDLSAVFAGDPDSEALYGAHQSGESEPCLGPETGV